MNALSLLQSYPAVPRLPAQMARLARFYAELARSEDGHHRLFVRLASEVHGARRVGARLEALLDAEAALLGSLPVRAAIH